MTTCRSAARPAAFAFGEANAERQNANERITLDIMANNKRADALRELNESKKLVSNLPMSRIGFSLGKTVVAFALMTTARAWAEPIIPTEEGTNWSYDLTQEIDADVVVPGLTPNHEGKIKSSVVYRLAGAETVGKQRFLKFEMHRNNQLTTTELMTIDDKGIRCAYRILSDGERVRLDPPQTTLALPLHQDNSWNFDGKAGGAKVHQHYVVMDQQDVIVPAGKFHAFRILGEQTLPDAMTIERWFVPGIGIVKDVTTMRNLHGERLQRIELVLKELPKVGPRPEVKAGKSLIGWLSTDPGGGPVDEFSSETPNIYASWKGHNLRKNAAIRAVWIGEDTGSVAPANYTIDEASTAAETPEAHGSFTLSKPEDGWAPGTYRLEFYVDSQLIDTVRATIKSVPEPKPTP